MMHSVSILQVSSLQRPVIRQVENANVEALAVEGFDGTDGVEFCATNAE